MLSLNSMINHCMQKTILSGDCLSALYYLVYIFIIHLYHRLLLPLSFYLIPIHCRMVYESAYGINEQ